MRPVGSKYLLEEPLGRGATGTVWRALVRPADADGAGGATLQPGVAVPVPGERVAIKVLREELANDPDVVMRFLRERSALLRLRHDNIVRVRDLVVEGELLALVMDLVQGPDLHRYLRENGRIAPAAGALLMAQVADALAASHADGIVHRDLKPANVLLATGPDAGGGADGSLGRPMLTDFGIARLADSPGVTRTHEFVGTPAYVAPETAEGLPQTSAVDVYGAGIMLYELVTGRPPFEGEGPLQILQAHLTQEARRPSMLPEPLWAVIERCLRKSPAERPSAAALANALRTVAAGIGVHATPEAIYAAERIAERLTPDPSPAAVPGTGTGPKDPTVPQGVSYDSAAPTVAASAPGVAGAAAAAAAARTEVLRADRQDAAATEVMRPQDRTQVLPPTGPPAGGQGGQAGPGGPGGPAAGSPHHPWETQLKAARTRNEQTQVGYLPPAPPQPAGRPQVAPEPYQNRPVRAPQPYAPAREPERGRPPQPDWERERARERERERERDRDRDREWERERERERRPRRDPRPRRRMRIPGGGCLRTLLMLVVIAALIWYLTPLHSWVDSVIHWWNGLVGTVNHVRDQVPKVHLPSTRSGG